MPEEIMPDVSSEEAAASGNDAPDDIASGGGETPETGPEDQESAPAFGTKSDDAFPDLSGVLSEQPVANPAEFQQLRQAHGAEAVHHNIDLLLDVKMPVAIELGRTELPISELLSMGPGSVVELDKLAGEPVDLLVNGKVIARGEVVVVDENFGVRITMLMSPEERLKSLSQR
jgi:flagellar motor switch protein FliN/FliY